MTATSELYVQSAQNVDRSGGTTWGTVGNITASDDTRSVTTLDGGLTSDYLYGQNIAPSLPVNAYIDGLIAKWEGDYFNAFAAQISGVGILIGGVRSGTEKTPNQVLTTSDVVYIYGSATDKWGLTRLQLVPSNINASTFGFYSWCTGSASGGSRVGVDAYSMIVHYTLYGIRPANGNATRFGLVNRGRAF